MPLYDNYHSFRPKPTALGKKMAIRAKAKFANVIQKLAPENRPKVLEIGPGKGLFALHCSSAFDYEAIEPNESMAQALRDQGISVTGGSVPGTPLPAAHFDAVYVDQVFEHLPSMNHQLEMLQEIHKTLTPNGLLALAAPEYESWREIFYVSDYTHQTPTSRISTLQMLYDTGFEIVKSGYCAWGIDGRFISAAISGAVRVADALGVTVLMGDAKRMKILSSLLRGFYVYARKK